MGQRIDDQKDHASLTKGKVEIERAALEWTEALTMISDKDAPDELYRRV